MIALVKEESFKLLHKRITIAVTLFLLGLMTLFAGLSKAYPKIYNPQSIFLETFTGGTWTVLFMIAACSSIITMEFQYGTIKELFYRQYYRGQVLISKWLTMLIYSIYFLVLVFGYTLLLKVVFFANDFDLNGKYGGEYGLLKTIFYSSLGEFVSLWLILSLVLMLANVFKSSAAAISVGIISYFAIGVTSGMMSLAIQKWHWFRWNPLNMINLPSQITDPSYAKTTMLSTNDMIWASLGYMVIFMAVSYFIFKKRSV